MTWLSDGDEVWNHGTDPTLTDTDADGAHDGLEIYSYGSDPFVVDTDGDGLTDYHWFRTWHGIAEGPAEIIPEKALPFECNLDRLNGVSFSCF